MQRVYTKFLWVMMVVMIGTASFSVQPTLAAGLVPCGVGDGPACTMCHLVIGINDIIKWGLGVMVFFAIAVIVAMGIVYIVSAGNSAMMSTAKNGIKSTLIGCVFMLGAWLIVNTIMLVLANNGVGKATTWNTFTCDTTSKAHQQNLTTAPTGGSGGSTGTGTGATGGGTCNAITDNNNPCSVDNLKKTCFADVAETMSKICNAESGGNPSANSGTDHCGMGGPTVSGGLFQINVTVHGQGCGEPTLQVANPPLKSVKKINGAWGDPNCKIIAGGPLDSCMNQTHTPSWNIDIACKIYKSQGLGAWGYSKTKCGL